MLDFNYLHKAACNVKFCEFLRQTRSHPKIVEHLFSSKKITRNEQEDWFIHVYKSDPLFRIYIATNTSHSEPIGYVSFNIDSPENRRCEVGFKVHPDYWGAGYGTEMIIWSIGAALAFEDYEIQRLWLTVFSNNNKAINLYKSCGFKREGTMRSYIYKDNVKRNVDIMAICL